MKFALYGNIHQAHKSQPVETLVGLLLERGEEVSVCGAFYRFLTETMHCPIPAGVEVVEDDAALQADMVISLGGDGTFLQTAGRVGRLGIPILGINTGRLGFLADVSPAEMDEALTEILNHSHRVEERSVLQLVCDDERLMHDPFALNEIAVLKRDSSSMISIRAAVDGTPLTTYQADGLIIATPTGSTAYSLSVGGPIIVPQLGTIALTPVAPHSLNMRPIVISDDWTVTLDVQSRNQSFLVSVDGRSNPCRQTTRLHIMKADYRVKVVKRSGHAFFDSLRGKMMWGADVR